jgi:hypothetical protein
MTARAARRLAKTSKLSVGLAVGTSATVGTAAALGHDFTAPEVAGAFAVAGAIAALNLRSNRPQAQPHTLIAVPDGSAAVTVMAPRARTLMAHPARSHDLPPARHTDAA